MRTMIRMLTVVGMLAAGGGLAMRRMPASMGDAGVAAS